MDKKVIMTTAWTIARKAAKKAECKVSEIDFGACLKIAWALARYESTTTTERMEALYSQFMEMVEEIVSISNGREICKLESFTRYQVKRAAARLIGESRTTLDDDDKQIAPGYTSEKENLAFTVAEGGLVDIGDYAQDTIRLVLQKLTCEKWMKQIDEKRKAKGLGPVTLKTIIWQSALAVVKNGRKKYISKLSHETSSNLAVGDDEDEVSLFDALSFTAWEQAQVESNSSLADQVCKDDVDHIIFQGLVGSVKYRDIAKKVGMSHVAVYKRAGKIKERIKSIA